MQTFTNDIATCTPCLLFTVTRVDGEVEYATNANVDITIGGTTWTKHAGLKAGVRTARLDGTPPTMGFQVKCGSSSPFKFQDVVRGNFEGARVQIELTSQDNPATRDFVFDGLILGETSYDQHGYVLFDLVSLFAFQRDIFVPKFTLMCRYFFGDWRTCRVPVFPHSTFPYNTDHQGHDPPQRNASYGEGSWRRYRFGSDGTPEDYRDVYLYSISSGLTAAVEPTFSDVVGDTVTDGAIIWETREAYARAAQIVNIDNHIVTLDRVPDARWTTTPELVSGGVKFFFDTGQYKGRGFKGAAWDADTKSFETYLPCEFAVAGDWITIAPECAHTYSACVAFGNARNHGGFPRQLGAKAQAQQLGYAV